MPSEPQHEETDAGWEQSFAEAAVALVALSLDNQATRERIAELERVY